MRDVLCIDDRIELVDKEEQYDKAETDVARKGGTFEKERGVAGGGVGTTSERSIESESKF
jgi:hypothetical protein